jgi:hypothetical protein
MWGEVASFRPDFKHMTTRGYTANVGAADDVKTDL